MRMKPLFARYIVILFVTAVVLRLIIIPWYDNNFGGIEPNIIYGIQRLLQGQPLYQDPSSGVYAIIQYTPLSYYFTAFMAHIVSPTAYDHGLDVHGLYTLSRALALLFNLLTVVVCAAIIRRTGWSRGKSFVYALPVFICLTPHYYTRGDSMHLFFFVCALYTYLLYRDTHRWPWLLSAAMCTALCIASKQSGILCAGIIILDLMVTTRKYVTALLFLPSLAAITCGILYMAGGANGYIMYQNIILGLKNGFDPGFLYRMFISRYFLDMVPCYLLCCFMLYAVAGIKRNSTARLLVYGAALCWLFAAATGIKTGSSNNYLTEFLVMVILALPYMLYDGQTHIIPVSVKGRKISLHGFATIAVFVLITSKTTGLFSAVFVERNFKNDKKEYAKELALYKYFREELRITPGEHIFFTERRFLDNLFFEYSVMPVKDVVTQVYTTNSTTFDYTVFAENANRGMINYIVTDEKRADINVCNDSLPFIHFDNKKFRLVATISGYCIYQYTG